MSYMIYCICIYIHTYSYECYLSGHPHYDYNQESRDLNLFQTQWPHSSKCQGSTPTWQQSITCWPAPYTLEGSLQTSRIAENKMINFSKTSLVILGTREPAGCTILSQKFLMIHWVLFKFGLFSPPLNMFFLVSVERIFCPDRGDTRVGFFAPCMRDTTILICQLTLFRLNCHKVHPHIEIHPKKGLAEMPIFCVFPSLSSTGLALRKGERKNIYSAIMNCALLD